MILLPRNHEQNISSSVENWNSITDCKQRVIRNKYLKCFVSAIVFATWIVWLPWNNGQNDVNFNILNFLAAVSHQQ